MSVRSFDRSSKESRSTAAREKDVMRGNSKGGGRRDHGKQPKLEVSGNSGNRHRGKPPKLEVTGNSGDWERYAPSEVSVSMVSTPSRPGPARAQSACSGSRRNSGSVSGYPVRRDRGHGSRRQDQRSVGTPIPESITSSLVDSLRRKDGVGNARRSPRADSKADSVADSRIGSRVSGASGQSSRRDHSQRYDSNMSGSHGQPSPVPSRSSACRTASEAPSGSYDMYGSEASSRNPTSMELAMANRMRQQRMVKTGRVFEGTTSYRDTFIPMAMEEQLVVPRGLMLHMHPEWAPGYSTGKNTTTSRAHFAAQTASDCRAAGSSTALQVSPMICDW